MGCQGIGIGRLMVAVIEQSHDEQRIIWPSGVAPYQIHLIALRTNHRSWTQRNLSMKNCKQSGMKFSMRSR